jgi:integrase
MRERGSGSLFREKYRDKKTGQLKACRTWTMKLWVGGKPLKRSSGTTSRAVANKKLEQWKAHIRQGIYVPDADQTRFDDLAALLLDEYRANARKSLDRVQGAVDHLGEFFKGCRARAISTERILAYVRHRQDREAANATINRELAALKRMFRLGEKAGKVVRRPSIDMLQENNARTGFFERDEFDAVLAQLPDDLKAVFEVGYITGWRVKSEILTRQWAHVDLQSGWLRLEPGETKNTEGRQFPLTPDLRAVLERQRERTLAIESATGTIIPWIFHRSGTPIKSFRRAWVTACKHASLSDRIPHDFRRTAVRNLERAGVPRSTAMKMIGHRTESIYWRYAIVDEAMLKEGAAKLQTLHDAQSTAAKVIPLTDAASARRFRSSIGRVTGTARGKIGRGVRGKSSMSEGKNMVGRDGIEPPTPGFSVLAFKWSHHSPSQLVTISKAHGRRNAMLQPIASCCATWVTISVTSARNTTSRTPRPVERTTAATDRL